MNNVFITTQIGALRRSNYNITVNSLQKKVDQDVASTESTEQCSAGTLASQPRTKKTKTQSSVAAFAQPISKQHTLELHALLCEAFVLGNIPDRFYENPTFQEYQRRLAVAIYTLPNRNQQRDQILPFLHANFMEDLLVRMKTTNKLTLSLDGWTDCPGVSIYAVMLHESHISEQ